MSRTNNESDDHSCSKWLKRGSLYEVYFSRFLFLAASLLALPVITAPVLAQQAPAASGQNEALEEIVVTAQRREESVLQVSDSVQAFTGAALTSRASPIWSIFNT